MMMKAILSMAVVIFSAINCVSATHLTKSFYLSLSPEALFAFGIKGNIGEGCAITLSTNTRTACDLYVKTATVGARGYRGWPRNRQNLGTGCVKAPEFPRGQTFCYFQRSEYNLPRSFRASICTDSGMTNASNQLRDAIHKGQCGLKN